MPGGRDVRGVLSFGYLSLHEQRKVTRSSAGGVEALALKQDREKQSPIKMDSGLTSSAVEERLAGMTS
jgi:hypothetical protein